MKINKKYIYAGVLLIAVGGIYIYIKRRERKEEAEKVIKVINKNFLEGMGGDTSANPLIVTGGQVKVNPKYDTKDQKNKKILEKVKNLPEGYFPLKVGDRNKKVARLQDALNRAYGLNITVDGLFGQETRDALCTNYIGFFRKAVDCAPFTDLEIDAEDYANILKKAK